MARPAFPKAAEKVSTNVLDIVHSDVCGPMPKVTPGGCRYYVTMIDDHSRFTFVYFLKRKSEVEEKIRGFVRMVETQVGRKPRAIRSDQGGEYSSKTLRQFYVDEGIQPQYTAAYSPQQNGISERKNRSLCEMARCMLLEAGLDQKYWAEAVNTACYLQNRLPTAAVERTPYEIWHGRMPDFSHLRLFGCSAYVMVPPVQRKKMDPKADKMIFVGYSDDHKAYRMLDPKSGKIVISRDVRFMELGDGSKQVTAVPSKKTDVELGESSGEAGLDDAESEEEFAGFDDDPAEPVGRNDDPPVNPPALGPRRSPRSTAGVPPVRYAYGVNTVQQREVEPKTYREAMDSPQRADWKSAMEDEMQSHYENGTWELAELPPNHRAIGCKWIYKCKTDENGKLVTFSVDAYHCQPEEDVSKTC